LRVVPERSPECGGGHAFEAVKRIGRNKEFGDPVALVRFIGEQGSLARIRPDQSVVFIRDWPTPEKRLQGSAVVMTQLARLAMKAAA
jgi:transcription-repair coupling factor (superfamily II helicase)